MMLVNILRHGSDQHAASLLARLRLGDAIEELITSVSDRVDDLPNDAGMVSCEP